MGAAVVTRRRAWRGVLRTVLRLAAALGAVLLGRWSYGILSHSWGENDAGLALYLGFASVPGVPAVLLMFLALRGWPRR